MNNTFSMQHGSMLLKYSGISFISGAVNHGFFSGERSIWTAVAGVVLFLAGAYFEHRLKAASSSDHTQDSVLPTLALGALLSIGLGFFTGGLQHFPDSPARSAWVVPLGFVLSAIALAKMERFAWGRSQTAYAAVVGLFVSAGSFGAWQWLELHPEWTGDHHGGSHAHDAGSHTAPAKASEGHAHDHTRASHDNGSHGQAALGSALQAMIINRTIDVTMNDEMRFLPAEISVAAGETVRFLVRNVGKIEHELVLGNEQEILAHAKQMQQAGAQHGHHGAIGAELTVLPGKTGELVVKFEQPTVFKMACLIPGHYEAGMRGELQVVAAAMQSADPPALPKQQVAPAPTAPPSPGAGTVHIHRDGKTHRH